VLKDDDAKGAERQSETTRSDGSFEFRSVPPGKYVLTCAGKGAVPRTATAKVEVAPGTVSPVTLRLYLSRR
jgi:hypothetical protein